MDKRKILIQLDCDPLPSVFDRVVAFDGGADEVFSYGGVKPEQVRDLVHGAIFTRHPDELHRTALFIGGGNVLAAEQLLAEAVQSMIPAARLRVSVLLEANGANTTAAAAVRAAARHVDLAKEHALVLGGTGPVGQRIALLLAKLGTEVRLASRQATRAVATANVIKSTVARATVDPIGINNLAELNVALRGRTVVIAAGAAGVVLFPRAARFGCESLKVAIDLNAVPPLGIEGIEVTDKAAEREGAICYGAVGVGGTKMKIHKAAIAKLFERNDQIMDAEEVFALAKDF
ncbi:MAG: methylene-tetrahydromethanopterin dehydrogenase N-terminal domain-containing protein [Candidatus Acidiferrum sp.]